MTAGRSSTLPSGPTYLVALRPRQGIHSCHELSRLIEFKMALCCAMGIGYIQAHVCKAVHIIEALGGNTATGLLCVDHGGVRDDLHGPRRGSTTATVRALFERDCGFRGRLLLSD